MNPSTPTDPFGAKEASEGALSSVLGAGRISGARDAIGIEMTETPMTLDRIPFKLLNRKRRKSSSKARKAVA